MKAIAITNARHSVTLACQGCSWTRYAGTDHADVDLSAASGHAEHFGHRVLAIDTAISVIESIDVPEPANV